MILIVFTKFIFNVIINLFVVPECFNEMPNPGEKEKNSFQVGQTVSGLCSMRIIMYQSESSTEKKLKLFRNVK